ncbi:ChbG/HpnK family deacetylase [Promicromonospora sp. NPDC059942]|uniref:ChbG/HpnK family deacetylase n=1 Tax=Promicromonospora sp. NPDC059942 TaxID=3347009 RepID=UPI00365E6B84
MTRSLVLTADDAGTDPDADREIAALLAGSPLTAVGVITTEPDGGVEDWVEAGGERDDGPHRDGADRPASPGQSQRQCQSESFGERPGESPGAVRAVGLVARSAPDIAPGVHVVLPTPGPAGGFDDVVDRIATQVDALMRATAAVGAPPPRRLDSHQGTLYGLQGRSYLGEAIGFCARHGLAFRLPRSLDLYGDGDPVLATADVRARHASAVVAADAAGVRLPEVIATHRGGDAEARDYVSLRDHYLRLLGRLPEGTSEIFLHPAPDTARLREASATWWRKRTWELRLLGDPVFIREIEREGIDLVSGW